MKVKVFFQKGNSFGNLDTSNIENQMEEFLDNNDIEIVDIRTTSNTYFLFIILLYKEK